MQQTVPYSVHYIQGAFLQMRIELSYMTHAFMKFLTTFFMLWGNYRVRFVKYLVSGSDSGVED